MPQCKQKHTYHQIHSLYLYQIAVLNYVHIRKIPTQSWSKIKTHDAKLILNWPKITPNILTILFGWHFAKSEQEIHDFSLSGK